MSDSGTGQAGGGVIASQGAVGFTVPEGLTYADLEEAAKFIESYGNEIANEAICPGPWSSDDHPGNEEIKLVVRVYEGLRAAAARNLETMKIRTG